jgi:NodT family efflux transporter outer membrane factor (OMF) lipoprotein
MMLNNMRQLILILATALLTVGCSVYQKYTRPENVSTKPLYGENVTGSDTTTMADIGWRDIFTDPLLQRLIEQGLKNNADMQIASQRIIASKASLRTAKLAFYPTFSFEPGITTKNHLGGSSTHSYSVPLSANWEIDIAGRTLNAKRKAEAAYQQSRIYRRSVQSRLIAEIANCYYTLLMLDAQLNISRSTAASWKENVRIMKAMKQAGMTNEASVSQTEANSCSIDASLFDLEHDIVKVENSLALLLGTTPQHFERGSIYDQRVTQNKLMVGIPAQLLSRRPDVQSAERALQQAFYNTNIARGSLYPSLRLSGSLGWQDELGKAVASPGSWLLSAAANLVADIFKSGQKRAALQVAKAQQQEALITFNHTLLAAGSEVNEALAQCQLAQSKTDIRRRQIEALESAVNSTRQLMSHSESTYLEVLTAQQKLLSAQLSQITAHFEAVQGTINLYHALGGGADEVESDDEKPQKRNKRKGKTAKK